MSVSVWASEEGGRFEVCEVGNVGGKCLLPNFFRDEGRPKSLWRGEGFDRRCCS